MPDKSIITPELAAKVAEHQHAAPDPDYWHACFAAALDEGLDVDRAIELANKAAATGDANLS